MSIQFIYNFCLSSDNADLQSDILSSVRKSYFSSFEKIKDKITISPESESISFDFSLEKDRPMKWMVRSFDGKILEESEHSIDGKYTVSVFEEDSLVKRLYFSKLHTLLKVDYFDRASGEAVDTIEPRRAKNGLCILHSKKGVSEPYVLFQVNDTDPTLTEDVMKADVSGEYCKVSSDQGIVFFVTDEQQKQITALLKEKAKERAADRDDLLCSADSPLADRINPKDFNIKRNLSASLDITQAKQFFAESTPAPENDADAATEETSATIGSQGISDEEISDPVSEQSLAESLALQALAQIRAAEAPDKVIASDGEQYRYYGELDEEGRRNGYGRTVTASGRTAYEGCYRNDKRSGSGSYFYKDGSLCYTGDWEENMRSGVGVGVSSKDRSVHVGTWKDNRPFGDGIRLSADGEIKFVLKTLENGRTVLINFMPDDSVIVSHYDEKGKKLGETKKSLLSFFE